MSQGSNQPAPVSDGRGAHARNGGGTGAPPSNTAPDNSNPSFRLLRWGIDSLYLSYPGELAEGVKANLRKLKLKAQGSEQEACKAQLQIGDHVFEVKDKSSGLFAFTLVDGAFNIRLSAGASKTLPMAYVQISSGFLAYKPVELIEYELRAILEELGDIGASKVSRIDLFADFASADSMEAWDRDAWVTRATAVHQYAEGSTFTGWTVGAGGVLMARLYHKLLECQKTGKDYLLGLWREAGWDDLTPVWRLEFEFRREALSQLKLDGLSSVLGNLDGLWDYATTDWLTLRCPNRQDQTRSRWEIHPLWMLLASVDWNTPGGSLSRSFKPTRGPSMAWIGSRALSLMASTASLNRHRNFEHAGIELMNVAADALSRRQEQKGLSPKGGFSEMVDDCNRKFNTALNDFEADPDPVLPNLQNPYYRAKQGFPNRGV
ncbi:replication initiation factor [Rhizobacter sp. Root404]|uniref:replication initiation factor n=1 Tax=Rhizobacter sp. Root404 TaxID=1736528 RepID=UPI000A4AF6FE|nr:replication initiation factor [Rhizobacter sp. Root404]